MTYVTVKNEKFVIMTGDLRIIENKKHRNLLTNGANYREPRNINLTESLLWKSLLVPLF